MNAGDLSVSFPAPGVILLRSRALFGDAENPVCRRLLERISQVEEISDVVVTPGERAHAALHFPASKWRLDDVVKRVIKVLRGEEQQKRAHLWEIKADR